MTHSDLTGARIGRRRLIQLTAAGLMLYAAPRSRAVASSYSVGVGKRADAYAATTHAVLASERWVPAIIRGRNVVIKPNLVRAATPQSGTVTDPEVVRAIVDLALAAGAAQVQIVEGGPGGAAFTGCGYDLFTSYDPAGRVSLVDLNDQPDTLVAVPGGSAYSAVFLPNLVLDDSCFLISVAKMKVHVETLVTLALKNAFGLPRYTRYAPAGQQSRMAMHDRSVNQTIVDLNLARPFDFAVVDGVWAMEGLGPWGGTPVNLNLVLAGDNALAVDLISLYAMDIPLASVQHLWNAVRAGLGPQRIEDITVLGDTFTQRPFLLPDIPPIVVPPQSDRLVVLPHGLPATIAYTVNRTSATRVEIVRVSEISPEIEVVRTLRDWTVVPGGTYSIAWDATADDGTLAAPGRYAIRVRATHGEVAHDAFASGWITVQDNPLPFRIFLPSLA